MNWELFLSAIALALIFEGLMPFAFPEKWRQTVQTIAEMNAGQIRLFGSLAITVGLIILLIFL
jgi:uncharacterized protein YjeT (DUF2065 family)